MTRPEQIQTTPPTAAALPELDELAEQIGEFVHYWGFKRIHGKIWTHIFLASHALDAADLVKKMAISKALVSISLRELMQYDVILTDGKSPRGTQLYKVNPDILQVILTVLRQREKRLLSRVQGAHETMGKVSAEEREKRGLSEQRHEQLGQLVGRASLALDSFISLRAVDFSDWRKVFYATDVEGEGLPESLQEADENAKMAAEPLALTSQL